MKITIARWPAFIVDLMLAFAAITCWSLERAISGVSPVIDANYYSHGLRYNNTNLELQTARARGWSINPQLDGRRLTINVQDAHQQGIKGCLGLITVLTKSADQEAMSSLTMTDKGDGNYTVEIPNGLPSPVAASLTLNKDQATVQRQLLLSLKE